MYDHQLLDKKSKRSKIAEKLTSIQILDTDWHWCGIISTCTTVHIISQWDGFPAWGVGLAVVRSGPSPGKGDISACTFRESESRVRNTKKKGYTQTPTRTRVSIITKSLNFKQHVGRKKYKTDIKHIWANRLSQFFPSSYLTFLIKDLPLLASRDCACPPNRH